MKLPFPGMDPYLEHPDLWSGLHTRLITALADALSPAVDPKYVVAVEVRLYLTTPPAAEFAGRTDVAVVGKGDGARGGDATGSRPSHTVVVELPMPDEVREAYLEVRKVGSRRVVTVIEILSPANKTLGKGRRLYLRKRESVLESLSHLVEIDLLRSGERMPARGYEGPCHYSILVSSEQERPRAELLPFSVRDSIPVFSLPLDKGDPEPKVDLGKVLAEVYERSRYKSWIDYDSESVPPLSGGDRTWARKRLVQAGLRKRTRA